MSNVRRAIQTRAQHFHHPGANQRVNHKDASSNPMKNVLEDQRVRRMSLKVFIAADPPC